jgi:hypothetical protein
LITIMYRELLNPTSTSYPLLVTLSTREDILQLGLPAVTIVGIGTLI